MSYKTNNIRRHSSQIPHQASAPGSPASLQRRESLVKPTWHNVCPGDVPPDTLEKLNKLSNGERHQLNQLNQYEGAQKEDDASTAIQIGGNNNSPLVSKVGSQRRQVELYDIFGKVNIMIVTYFFQQI